MKLLKVITTFALLCTQSVYSQYRTTEINGIQIQVQENVPDSTIFQLKYKLNQLNSLNIPFINSPTTPIKIWLDERDEDISGCGTYYEKNNENLINWMKENNKNLEKLGGIVINGKNFVGDLCRLNHPFMLLEKISYAFLDSNKEIKKTIQEFYKNWTISINFKNFKSHRRVIKISDSSIGGTLETLSLWKESQPFFNENNSIFFFGELTKSIFGINQNSPINILELSNSDIPEIKTVIEFITKIWEMNSFTPGSIYSTNLNYVKTSIQNNCQFGISIFLVDTNGIKTKLGKDINKKQRLILKKIMDGVLILIENSITGAFISSFRALEFSSLVMACPYEKLYDAQFCIDEKEDCKRMADNDGCNLNPVYMNQFCEASCKICDNIIPAGIFLYKPTLLGNGFATKK